MIKDKLHRAEEAIIFAFERVGEDFVTNGRNLGSYTDRTGNLRSSVGYVILKDGLQLTMGGFVKIKPARKAVSLKRKSKKAAMAIPLTGPQVGEDFALEIQKEFAAKYQNAIVLICVAGMHYAAAVEAKGFDVITGSSQIAKKQLKDSIERIGRKISTAA